MRNFLRGCKVGLYIVGIVATSTIWLYVFTLISPMPLSLLYVAGTIILTCGFVGWYANP